MKVFWNQIVVGDEDEGMVDEVDVGGGGIVNLSTILTRNCRAGCVYVY